MHKLYADNFIAFRSIANYRYYSIALMRKFDILYEAANCFILKQYFSATLVFL